MAKTKLIIKDDQVLVDAELIFEEIKKGRLSRLDGSFYGFLLSDYLKDILKVFREGSMAHEFIFNLAKRLLLVEDGFFNYLGIKRSEGMFNVYRKI